MRIAALLAGLAATVLLAAGAPAEWSSAPHREVALEGDGSSLLVSATLNGTVRGLFILDTGATVCVLEPALAKRLRLDTDGPDVELRTANGVARAPLVQLRTVDVGGNRARDVVAVVHQAVPPPADGVIGLSFLNNFTYAVDSRRRVLTLR